MNTRGFTLIELLVVITIIGVLASVTLSSLDSARENAKAVSAINDMRTLKNASAIYLNHTNTYPPSCGAGCSPATDPFMNALSAPNWRGPYGSIWDKTHPWRGGYGTAYYETEGNGEFEFMIMLDDDRPGTNSTDNQGAIPLEVLVRMDEILDDGNLATGNFFGDARDSRAISGGPLSAVGEGIWITGL